MKQLMPFNPKPLTIILIVLTFCIATLGQTTTFTYQGRFNDTTLPSPTNGTYNMQFALFDALTGGTQIGSTVTNATVQVTNGFFTVSLDYGAASFPGPARFLEIRVLDTATTSYLNLSPRQEITSTPYAIRSLNATNAGDSARLGGVPASQYVTGPVVTSLNNLNDNVMLAGGTNITITPSGNTLTIAATGSGSGGIFNQMTLQTGADFNIDGTGKANILNATTQFSLANNRVLSANGTNNLFVGINAGLLNSTGTVNTFVGRNAGLVNTTGSRNSFFGALAGVDNTAGTDNSFFGVSAGANTTTGDDNSFFGVNAGFSNTTGNRNTFVGTNSGSSNTTGNGLTFFGVKAGNANTSGVENAFFGENSGEDNTDGNSNAFFGTRAGASNISGDANSFFGTNAGVVNNSGFSNSFFGLNAGFKTTIGNNNTFVGTQAGFDNTTGSNNTLIGNNADVGLDNLTFGTAIGAGAVVENSNTIQLGRDGSDQVRIGAFGTGGSSTLCTGFGKIISVCSSSLRYKTNIAPFSDGLSFINQLRPISFDWKESGMKDVGFGAEDVAKINPLFVVYNEKGEVEGVKYDRFSVLFVNAFKEQQTQITEQKEQIKLLKTQNQNQQFIINELQKLVCLNNQDAEICKEKK